jgi:DNA-binding NtrC family response regulator
VGLLESANGGTVFLDEVGEMPLSLQAKLLRVLEQREVLRVGSLRPRAIDVRFLSATNRDLEAEIREGRFRQDLFFRLNGMPLRIPPLRERVEEIEGLANAFARQAAEAGRREVPVISRPVLALLKRYSWPGNIRELRNAVERALSLGSLLRARDPEEGAGPAHEGLRVDLSEPLQAGLTRVKEAYEKAYVEAALAEAGGNVTHAARIAQVDRKSIQRAMSYYKLRGKGEE